MIVLISFEFAGKGNLEGSVILWGAGLKPRPSISAKCDKDFSSLVPYWNRCMLFHTEVLGKFAKSSAQICGDFARAVGRPIQRSHSQGALIVKFSQCRRENHWLPSQGCLPQCFDPLTVPAQPELPALKDQQHERRFVVCTYVQSSLQENPQH
jgi:hypothetical protein